MILVKSGEVFSRWGDLEFIMLVLIRQEQF